MTRLAGVTVVLAFATAAIAQDGPTLWPAARDVTPPGVTPGPRVEGPLVRVPAPPRPPEPLRWWRFFLPVTTDSATFVASGRTIHVAGVVPAPVKLTCLMPDGSVWPCGRTALTSLRLFLRGRAVECHYVLDETTPKEITAPCRVGPTDIGQWLLGQGWATPAEAASEIYRRDASAARCAGRGLWRGQPVAEDCAETK